MANKVSDISEDDVRKVFLHLSRLFEDDVKKNLHVQEIKTEVIGLYEIKITVKKDIFTRDEVNFLFSLINSQYVKKRLKIKISFFTNIKDFSKGGVEITIVPKPQLISYFVKRLKYY